MKQVTWTGYLFRELSDGQGRFLRPLLLPKASTGPPRADERETLNGILSVLVTGCRWMDMPREDGSSKTAWRRLQEWQQRGVWQRLLDTGYPAGRLEGRAVAADATTIEARKGGRR
jgi:transposase